MSRCRSCQAQVVWARHHKTGSNMIFDAEKVFPMPGVSQAGLFHLRRTGNETEAWPMAEAVTKTAKHWGISEAEAAERLRDVGLYQSHFATCPNAESHRQQKPG